MIGLADFVLAARSRRRHRLPEECRESRSARLVRLSAASLAVALHADLSGAWRDQDNAQRTETAKRLKFAATLVLSGRIGEGLP